MESSEAIALRSLLEYQRVAALATLHEGEPAVSMTPYAWFPQGRGFVIHVSRLAMHTRDMLANPAVGLLMTAAPDPAVSPLALPRVSFRGCARQCLPAAVEHEPARAAYLTRFPESMELFSFTDFSLFVVEVRSARYVAGFGRAMTVGADQFAALMHGTV